MFSQFSGSVFRSNQVGFLLFWFHSTQLDEFLMKNKGDKEGKMVRKRGGTKPTFIDIPEGQVS